jgi:ABC-type nitrate/sulfonate/bicarbonate transport system substrate-binding protein
MKNIKKIPCLIAITLVLALISATSDAAEYKYGKIDIPGKDGALCGAPIYIAYERGFFAEEVLT